MAVFAIGQHDAGEECAQRRRQADQCHQQGNADHDHQGRGGEKLAHLRPGDVAKDGPRQIGANPDDRADCGQRDQGALPAAQPVHEIEVKAGALAMGGGFGGMAAGQQIGQGEERDDGQHRDDGNVLEEQDGKTGAPAIAARKALLVQRLQHDGRRGERQDHANGEGGLPGLAEGHRDAGHAGERAQDL